MCKIFYNSSMPRSGSTLFQQIVGQNPEFYVSPTSGLINLVNSAKAAYTASPEFKAVDRSITKKPFLQFCKNGMESYCSTITDKLYVLDKSRGWGVNYNFIKDIFDENPKIVYIARDLRDIIASMEKKYRNSTTINSGTSDPLTLKGTTQLKRTIDWCASMPVGNALDWTLDILQSEIKSNILFIRYEDLLSDPESQMKRFYEYMEVPYFEHDFNNIKQVTFENDEIHGIYGDHKIQEGKLGEYKPTFQNVLPPESIEYLENNFKWYFEFFNYLYTTKQK